MLKSIVAAIAIFFASIFGGHQVATSTDPGTDTSGSGSGTSGDSTTSTATSITP